MATKKMTVTVTTGSQARRTGTTAKKRKPGTLRTGEKLKPKKPVTENPFTWVTWLFTTLHNTRKRTRAGRQALAEKQETWSDWSHRKGEQMHQNRQAKRARRDTFKRNMKGMVECKNCTVDDQGNPTSTWHRPSDVLKHIDDEHPAKPSATPPTKRTKTAKGGGGTAAAAAGGAALGKAMARAAHGKIDHSNHPSPPNDNSSFPVLKPCPKCGIDLSPAEFATHRCPPNSTFQPSSNDDGSIDDTYKAIERQNQIDKEARKQRHQPGKHRADGNVTRGPWRGSARGTGSARSERWRQGMAGLDGISETMNNWAANPPETWEQSMAEAEQAAEEFRGMADAFRRRAEAEVEQNNIAPECVEPYDEAANIMSQVGDHIAEVATRIQQKYGEVKEMADRGELPREQFLNDGSAKSASGRGGR